MRLKLLMMALVACLAGAGTYAAMPFVSAWQIREAVRLGDQATLARKVDWPSVRQSLKSSLDETRRAVAELSDTAGQPRPNLWQRLKVAALPYLADPLIDRYVTPEGATRLYAWRQTWRQRVQPVLGAKPPETLFTGTWLAGSSLDRGLALARRVDRARFASLDRLEIELADRTVEGRRWFAALERRGLDWQLTEMKAMAGPKPAPLNAAPARTTDLR